MTDNASIWRVCRVINGGCAECPESQIIDGERWIRGCRSLAEECINVVETGNPWRKTEGAVGDLIARLRKAGRLLKGGQFGPESEAIDEAAAALTASQRREEVMRGALEEADEALAYVFERHMLDSGSPPFGITGRAFRDRDDVLCKVLDRRRARQALRATEGEG